MCKNRIFKIILSDDGDLIKMEIFRYKKKYFWSKNPIWKLRHTEVVSKDDHVIFALIEGFKSLYTTIIINNSETLLRIPIPKRYFLKFLPVRDKIEVGDVVRHPSYGDGKLIMVYTETEVDVLSDGGVKQVLHVCDKNWFLNDDIQVAYPDRLAMHPAKLLGILSWVGNGEENFSAKVTLPEFAIPSYTLMENCFKVIGRVSPEATWAKENNEFLFCDVYPITNDGIGQSIVKIKNPKTGNFD